jgi:hypothetical protein
MPKKPTKIIIKFSNDSTTKEKPKKPKKSGPSNTDGRKANGGPRKLRS